MVALKERLPELIIVPAHDIRAFAEMPKLSQASSEAAQLAIQTKKKSNLSISESDMSWKEGVICKPKSIKPAVFPGMAEVPI